MLNSRTEDEILRDARIVIDDLIDPYMVSEARLKILFSLGLSLCDIPRSDNYTEHLANLLIEFIINNIQDRDIWPIRRTAKSLNDHLEYIEAFDIADAVIEKAYPNIYNKEKGYWGEQRVPNWGILRSSIAEAIFAERKACKEQKI